MNVLMLNYEFPPIGGGGAVVSLDIAKGYVKLGHHVTVVTMRYKDTPMYEELGKIKIYRIKCLRSKKLVCYPLEQLTYIISAIIFLKKHLKQNMYNINHTHFIFPTGLIALWLKKNYNMNYIITAHGSDVPGHNTRRFKLLHKVLKRPWINIIKESEFVTTPSDSLLKLIRANTKEGQIKIVPNGINTKIYEVHKKKKRIILISRLQETKGIQHVLKALSMVDLKEWKVDIVGDGPYRDVLQQQSKSLGLDEKIKFHGWIKNKSREHINLLADASVFISASEFESYGISVVEAIASNCYPLISDIDAHRELLTNEEFFFEKNNIEMLAKKISMLIEQDTIEVNISKEKYDWNKIILLYENILLEAMRNENR